MKVVFLDNFYVNIGIGSVSALLKQRGHEVELFTHRFSKLANVDLYQKPERHFDFDKIADEVLAAKPDVVGFSVFSANYMFFKRCVEKIKERSDVPTIVGGVLPTLTSELFIKNTKVDCVFRGEPEPICGELFEKVAKFDFEDVPNLVYRKGDEIVKNGWTSYNLDLDKYPDYDRSIYPEDHIHYNTVTSRGCMKVCTFCSAGEHTRLTTGTGRRAVRKRGVPTVIKEIKAALRESPREEILFWDDYFISSTPYLEEFAEAYAKEIGIPYQIVAFPTQLSEKRVKLLADSGCNRVLLGFQTANNEYKKNILKRYDKKEDVAEALQLLKRHGIKYSIDHIFNLPGETREHIHEAIDFYLDNDVAYPQLFFLNYYPDSELTRYAHREGYINDEQFEKIMKNEMLGEQSYMGTVVDPVKSRWQVQYAILIKLMAFIPKRTTRFIMRHDLQRFFPVSKHVLYGLAGLNYIKAIGFTPLIAILATNVPFLRSASDAPFVRFFRAHLQKVFGAT